MSNTHLHEAKRKKNDCFYTRRQDVDKELAHYEEQLEGKWVYMPCDTAKSAFWQYFKDNFNKLKLKHITATSWYQDNPDGKGHRLDYDGVEETDVILEGNGDFQSEECTNIMKSSDIVITNPPFSLFRAFIKWLNYDGE